jgi:hypothetical protein
MKYALLISITLNLLFIVDYTCIVDIIPTNCEETSQLVAPLPCACYDDHRYVGAIEGGGIEVPKDEARELVQYFVEQNPSVALRGGFLSKIAIDSMFCRDTLANGVWCFFGQDPNGTKTTVFETGKIVNTKVTFLPHSHELIRTFISETKCPMQCDLTYSGNF